MILTEQEFINLKTKPTEIEKDIFNYHDVYVFRHKNYFYITKNKFATPSGLCYPDWPSFLLTRNKKFLNFEINRCGSTTILDSFITADYMIRPNDPWDTRSNVYNRVPYLYRSSINISEYKTFFVWRDPIKRLISQLTAMSTFLTGCFTNKNHPFLSMTAREKLDFGKICLKIQTKYNIEENPHMLTMYNSLKYSTDNFELKPDFVVPIEKLKKFLEKECYTLFFDKGKETKTDMFSDIINENDINELKTILKKDYELIDIYKEKIYE